MSTVYSSLPAGRPAGAYRVPQRGKRGARGLAALLLAAVVASLVVVADRLISTWADGGHLLMAWVVLWAVVFAGMALFAGAARRAARALLARADRWARAKAERRADVRLWAMAKADPRIMRELMATRLRDDGSSFEAALAPLGMDLRPAGKA